MAIAKASPLFGKINVYEPEGGKQRVEIYIRLDQSVEHMKVGIAIDASASMKTHYAANIPKMVRQPGQNVMEPVVRQLCRFVCDYSGDGTVLPIYWAVGPGGKEIESIGVLDGLRAETMPVDGPKRPWGTGTCLLPALNFFLEQFASAEWAILLFVTDGVIEDLEDVKARALEVGHEIKGGKRANCKFVVVGIGEADEEQLDELDNMFDGTDLEEDVDLWDCKLAGDMAELAEIWDEVDFGISLPMSARITDSAGAVVKAYADEVPQRMEFDVPMGTKSVTLEIAGQTIVQSLEEG